VGDEFTLDIMKFCYHVYLIKRVQNFVCAGSFSTDFLVESIILSSTWSETSCFIIVKCQRLLSKCHLYFQLKLEVYLNIKAHSWTIWQLSCDFTLSLGYSSCTPIGTARPTEAISTLLPVF